MSFPQASDYRPPIIPDGDIYDNPENGKLYYWTQILLPEGSTPDTATSIGGYWTVVCEPADPIFVLKAGDTMTGTLEIANEDDITNVDFEPDKANLTFTTTKTDASASTSVSIHQNGYNNSIGITGGVLANGSYFSQTGKYYGADPSGQYFDTRSPRLQLEELEGTLQWDNSARVQWNEFNVEIPRPYADDVNGDGLAIRGTTANGYETTDPDDQNGKLLSVYHNANTADAVNYNGKINSDANLVNKGYVNSQDEVLQRKIEILQEEIEAIIPTTDKGIWQDGASATPGIGHFSMRVTGGAITQDYEDRDIDQIIISTTAKDGSSHSFLTESVGDLIQLFDVEDKNYGLFEIAAIDTTSSTEYVSFDVIWVQGLGATNVDDDVLVKTFAPPSGGTASEFVLKTGDTMTGTLKIDVSEGGPTSNPGAAGKEASLMLKGDRTTTTDAAVTITFDNEASSYPGYLTYRSNSSNNQFFRFSENVEFNNKALSGIYSIDIKTDLKRMGAKRITFQTDGSGEGQGSVVIHRATDLNKGFTIRGKIKNSTSQDLLYAYSNSGSNGDSIDYHGICTNGPHIMSRDHGDSRFVQTGTKGIKITKSSGNYYIQG